MATPIPDICSSNAVSQELLILPLFKICSPNAGVGLRIEVQPRMNVRLDFGRNFANDQSLFYFNMTEAF